MSEGKQSKLIFHSECELNKHRQISKENCVAHLGWRGNYKATNISYRKENPFLI